MITTGIDVSKAKLDVFFSHMPYKKHETFSNTPQGIEAIVRRLPENAFVIFESTGPYSKLLYKTLCEKGIKCCCANPYQVLRFAQGMGRHAKTDKIDARILAEYGDKAEPEPTQFKSDKDLELYELVSTRDVLMHDIRAHKNRLEIEFSSDKVNQVYLDIIKKLEEELSKIYQAIDDFMKQNEKYAKKKEQLETIPGIGSISAAAILAYGPEIGTVSGKQFSALIGLAPRTKQSGSTLMHDHIGGGRPALRKAWYMPALSAIKCNPEMRKFYDKLKAKGKSSKVAIVAVMRKMSGYANSVIKRQVNFEKEGKPSLQKLAA